MHSIPQYVHNIPT